MPSVMAIVSKAIFEKEARGLAPGDVWATRCYVSQNKGLIPLAQGGDLYLVTVRPPEELWLVAVLRNPRSSAAGWESEKNGTAIRVIDGLKGSLKFATGTGITARAGALGMSLQTPRVLTDGDLTLLQGTPAPGPRPALPAPTVAKPEPVPVRSAQIVDGELPELTSALAELGQDRPGAALIQVLAAWRKHRAPALADLLALVSKQVDRSLAPLEGPKAELQTRWLDLAARRRAVDLGRLLASLRGTSLGNVRKRFELLGAFAPDSRLIAPMLEAPQGYSYEAGPMYSMAFDVTAQSGDPRARPILDRMLTGALSPQKGDSSAWKEYLAKHSRRAQKVRDGLPESVPLSSQVEAQVIRCQKECQRLLASEQLCTEEEIVAQGSVAPAKPDRLLDDLLGAVLSRPDDDQARAVYADALQEKSDPRGELIALQLLREQGELSSAGEKRERELLKKHGRSWIAPLDAAIKPDSIRFARGFLDACRVEFRTPGQRKELGGHPLWATVRELDCDDQSFVTDPGLISLRRANLTSKSLAELAGRERPVPLEQVIGTLQMSYGIRMRFGMWVGRPALWGQSLEVGALTQLRALQLKGWGGRDEDEDEIEDAPELTPAGLRWLLDSKLGRQIKELDLMPANDRYAIAPWIEEIALRRDDLRVRIRFTNGNTASGSTNVLVVFDLAHQAGKIDVTMSVNHDLVDIRYLTIGREIRASLAGLPSTHGPAVTVRYIGSKKRTQLGFPSIAAMLEASFSSVSLE